MIFLYSPPDSVELPPGLQRWTHCIHRWTCGEESWDLSSEESGTFLAPGVRGMNMPPIQHYRRKSASVEGSQWRGSITDQREVFWPLSVCSGDGSLAWLEYNRRFWATMRPDRTGVWSVTRPAGDGIGGETRYLTLRFDDDGQYAEDIAPELVGWADYAITLTAEQPYWLGEPIGMSWNRQQLVNYYGGGPVDEPGFGPPFVTSASTSLDTAAILNPGDLPALPVWTVFGPWTAATLGVGDKLIIIPFAGTSGQWLRIDTARTDRRAMFGSGAVLDGDQWTLPADILATGTNRTRDLGAATRFGEVPPGSPAPLSISMTGNGSVDVEIVPRYYMAR